MTTLFSDSLLEASETAKLARMKIVEAGTDQSPTAPSLVVRYRVTQEREGFPEGGLQMPRPEISTQRIISTSGLLPSLFSAGQLPGAPPLFRKPPPAGVVEVLGKVGRGWSLVALKDGTLLATRGRGYRTSGDEGLTWSETHPWPGGVSGQGLLRLKSGALVLYDAKELRISQDEGRSWGAARPIQLMGSPYYATMIQLESGRLLYPNRVTYSNTDQPDLSRKATDTFGIWRGLRRQLAGHYHHPEIDVASVSYSDDEGQTWTRCRGSLMGWFDEQGIPNGYGGLSACDEPSVAETENGRVLFLARSTVGRVVQTFSRDGGVTWTAVKPSALAGSYSPPRLVRIPQTGDLMCVWNQVSREEIRRGYRRGRLSVAISQDSGASWKNFRTLEVSAGLEDVARTPEEHPIKPVIGLHEVGQIPNDFAVFRYPNVGFSGGRVYIMYAREWFELEKDQSPNFEGSEPHRIIQGRQQVLRIYPLEYFYQ